jgi:hypothetical protein
MFLPAYAFIYKWSDHRGRQKRFNDALDDDAQYMLLPQYLMPCVRYDFTNHMLCLDNLKVELDTLVYYFCTRISH